MPEPAQPRVLLVTRNLPPLVGGMERLNWHLAHELAGFSDVAVVGPRGSAGVAPDGVRVAEVPLRPLPAFLLRSLARARVEARRAAPAWVLAGSGLVAPAAWLAARSAGARSAAYLHGLDITARSVVYRSAWLPMIRRMDLVLANSQATRGLAEAAGVDPVRIRVLFPGVALAPPPPPAAVAALRGAHAPGAGPLLLSVGRLTRRKGLREFVRDVLPAVVARHPEAVLLVVGTAPSDALAADSDPVEAIQAAAGEAGVGQALRFAGRLSEPELQAAYAAADLHVFPVRHREGDPEGFGMVAVEAAAHGLATVAYACGGVADAVADGVSGRLVRPGDAAAFAEAVLGLLEQPLPAERIRGHAAGFAWPRFGARLRGLLFPEDPSPR